jgi:hypothetical protein
MGINDTAPRGTPQPIITDGSHIRSLYMDTFYIDDPTLAFVNSVYWVGTLYLFSPECLTIYLANSGTQFFTYSEYLSLAIAKVWAGKADLPSTSELWRRYDKLVKDRGGYGKHFQVLGAKQMKGKFCSNLNILFLYFFLSFFLS